MTADPSDVDSDDVLYDRATGAYRFLADWAAGEPLSVRLVLAVSEVAGVEPTDLEPLDRHVSVDALDALFDRQSSRSPSPDRSISFTYAGYRVTATGDGELVVEPPADR